jgi:hypothetical protein
MAIERFALPQASIIGCSRTGILILVLLSITILQTLPCTAGPTLIVIISARIWVRRLREDLLAVIGRLFTVVISS